MRIDIITHKECIAACADLFRESDREIGSTDTVCLDEKLYRALDRSASFCVAAWADSGEPVAVASVIIARDPHHSVITATNDTLYVRPEYRASILPGRLFFALEREARFRGAERFQWRVPCGSGLERALEKRQAYRRRETLFEKEL